MKKVRCAIYTRKSSEEGLEQDFNSLDAQREACAAYVISQASEGWSLSPEPYDDGGISGGTLERPALQRLLADIAAGRIDIVVVYKVDRLTRSLLDFARLVEAFDKAGVSFVSVTQSFNTTTSMGRLTLNMLLSFAQFEREVTAERIRDKIAASKAKGMWVGGTPPLGYRPDGRSLAIVADHAALIRDIYWRYMASGNVRRMAEQLEAEGIRTPCRTTSTGRAFGGVPFSRGQLYKILGNPIYVGDIAHHGKLYKGQHKAIIERGIWERVPLLMSEHVRGEQPTRMPTRSLLAGLVVDANGEPLVATHATKKKLRYRYYVSRALQHDPGAVADGMRIPAREIEAAVVRAIDAELSDPLTLLDKAHVAIETHDLLPVVRGAKQPHAALGNSDEGKSDDKFVRKLIAQVRVSPREVQVELLTKALIEALGLDLRDTRNPNIVIASPVRLTRTGRAIQLVDGKGRAAAASTPDQALINLLLRAREWWKRLADGKTDMATIAREENINDSYVSRVVRLNFLAPQLIEAILDGSQPATLSGKILKAADLPIEWDRQLELLGSQS